MCIERVFFPYRIVNKCRKPCHETFYSMKETPLRMKHIRNTLFFKVNATAVESPCKVISSDERCHREKMLVKNDLSKQKMGNMTNVYGTSFFFVQKSQ